MWSNERGKGEASLSPGSQESQSEDGYSAGSWTYKDESRRSDLNLDGKDQDGAAVRPIPREANTNNLPDEQRADVAGRIIEPPFPSPDGLLPWHMSAFEYAIAPYLERSSISYNMFNFPSPEKPPASPETPSPTPISSFPSSINVQLYLPPPREDKLPHYLKNMTTEERIRKNALHTILNRCIALATPVVDWETKTNATPLENYDRICRLIRRHALPIAESLDIDSLQGVCYYWLGRGESGLQRWQSAERAFEEALRRDISEEHMRFIPKQHGENIFYWREKVRGEMAKEKENEQGIDLPSVEQELDRRYWDAQQRNGGLDEVASEKVLPSAWLPEEALRHEEFTDSDLEYVNSVVKGVEGMMENVESMTARTNWEMAQKS